jgi:CRISPR-associated protein Cas1
VAGKIVNQRQLLINRQRVHPSEKVAEALSSIRALQRRLESPLERDVLMGIEGQAANLYFGTFTELVRNDRFVWKGRNRRPPRDPINACLSYGYTLLCGRTEAAVRQAGLDPYLGVLHEVGRGRSSLSLDLAEEFRPMVDGVVLTLLNRQMLCPEDFGPPDADLFADEPELSQEGAVYLSRTGRSILLKAWTQKLAERSPHPSLEGDWSVAGLIKSQGQALARALEQGVPYLPTRIC